MMEDRRTSRKEKRLLRNNKEKVEQEYKPNFQLKKIEPLTANQKIAFEAYNQGKNLMLHGIAGTGKSFISMYLALNEIITNPDSSYDRVIIVRSVVPTRDMGFLPGNSKEKAKVYEAPYYAICTELFGRGDAYEILKNKGQVDFISTSFIRGITLNNTIIIVDEMQNMTGHELDSIITRIGNHCRIVFCGDFRQSDFVKDNDKKGLMGFMNVIERLQSFSFIDFEEEDIVRSRLVKEYIIQKTRLGFVV
jgi:phosphate starvation-inducible protein PhoH